MTSQTNMRTLSMKMINDKMKLTFFTYFECSHWVQIIILKNKIKYDKMKSNKIETKQNEIGISDISTARKINMRSN